jgi:UDP-glucose 4-epimerase
MKDEYFDVNVNGTENMFKLAKEYGFKIVYASSSSVYGNPKKIPITENDDRKPINPYAQTKLDDEVLAKKYSEMGVRVIGLRYFNVFGPRQSKEYAGVIKLFLEKIKQKIPPKINGDGLQTRDFVHIDDVVMANILAMDSNIKHEFFNVGTGNSISILELANAIIRASSLSLEPIHGPELSGDVRATQADTTLIRKLLNWEPTIRLDDWVTKIISNKDFQYI